MFIIYNDIFVLNTIFRFCDHNIERLMNVILIFIKEYINDAEVLKKAQYGILVQKLLESFSFSYPLLSNLTIKTIDVCFYER